MEYSDTATYLFRLRLEEQLQRKKETLEVAKNRRHLRLQSIQTCYEAEELAALQDLKNQKTSILEEMKSSLQKKIRDTECLWEDYVAARDSRENKSPRSNETWSAACDSPPPCKKQVKAKGPFIVYRLTDEEVEEDLKIIRNAVRSREFSPESKPPPETAPPVPDSESDVPSVFQHLSSSVERPPSPAPEDVYSASKQLDVQTKTDRGVIANEAQATAVHFSSPYVSYVRSPKPCTNVPSAQHHVVVKTHYLYRAELLKYRSYEFRQPEEAEVGSFSHSESWSAVSDSFSILEGLLTEGLSRPCPPDGEMSSHSVFPSADIYAGFETVSQEGWSSLDNVAMSIDVTTHSDSSRSSTASRENA